MTLENTLLEKLSEWQPAAGRQELYVPVEGWNTTIAADRSDVLGCLLWELSVRRDGTDGVDLQKWATSVARQAGDLSLKIVEIDTTRNEAQLRSETPQQRGGKRLYHELLLSSLGTAVLRRFQAADGNKARQQVAFAVTHEALAKLASDIVAAA